MDLLTPDEFYRRVGVRVPDSVIRNLEARRWRYPTDEIVDDAVYPNYRPWRRCTGGMMDHFTKEREFGK